METSPAPNLQPAQSPQQSHLKRSLRYLQNKPQELLALIVLALIVLGVFSAWVTVAYRHHADNVAIAQERAQFEQAEIALGSFSKSISSLKTPSSAIAKYSNCSRPHQTFSRGSLACDVGDKIKYSISGKSDAQNLVSDISKVFRDILAKNKTVKYANGTSRFDNSSTVNSRELISEYYIDPVTKLNCGVGYEYLESEVAARMYSEDTLESYPGLVVDVSCSGLAKFAYYPINN